MNTLSVAEKYEDQIRQLFAGIVWTHKIQEKQADIYRSKYNTIEFFRILTSAITTSGIVTAIFIDENLLKILTAIISAISLFIATYFKTYDLKALAKKHKGTANLLFMLREKVILTLTEIHCHEISDDYIKQKLDDIYEQYFSICSNAEDANSKAVASAANALNNGNEFTYSDEEIDRFLPIFLRKSGDVSNGHS